MRGNHRVHRTNGCATALELSPQVTVDPRRVRIERQDVERSQKHLQRLAIACRVTFGYAEGEFSSHDASPPDFAHPVLLKSGQHCRGLSVDDVNADVGVEQDHDPRSGRTWTLTCSSGC